MAYYITTLAHALLPLALAMALFPAATAAERAGPRFFAAAGGLVLGGLLALTAALRAAETSVGTGLRGGALVLALVTLVALLAGMAGPARRAAGGALRILGPLLVAGLAAQGVYDAWDMSATHSLTATDVVNTELIVNSAAIVVGLALLVALAATVRPVAALAGATAAALVLAALLAVEAVTGSAEVMLGLLRLDHLAVTGGRVSYVARVSVVGTWAVYIHLGLVVVLAVVAFRRRARAPETPQDAPQIERVRLRRQRAVALLQRRWRQGAAGIAAVLVATLLYQDLYADRPPTLSAATRVAGGEAGDIRIPIDTVKDGTLHRYDYIASDGHRVRFFLINRYDAEHVHMGVVYDACMICGDDGYVQRGEEIICIACNVRIFRPSIGKPGGCNPIPLVHAVEDGSIVIATGDLEKGARYFSEVVEVAVTDPVTGDSLTNTEAPYRYDYGGRTYFFGGEESYERFRDDPEAFTNGQEARYMRVQGHQSTGG
jgi:uncharacterized membrane protein/YHS domain-containing protein